MSHTEDKILQAKPALHIPACLVWGLSFAFVLTALGSYGILSNNEGLYAEIPREMLASHDWRQWVIPHLNGLPYMEKPPLLYWLTALSFSLFGISEWSARLVPALSALTCVASLMRFGAAVQRPQAGRLAALMFISGVGVAVMSRTLMFDMLLTACLTAALTDAYRYGESGQVGLLRRAYAWLALALMAKGFVALVLFGAVMAGMLLPPLRSVADFLRLCRAWLEPGALLIFAAIAVPWHIAASMAEPVFPWFYFINEHVLRFLGRREPHDYYAGAWWYYLPRMALYLFPWSLLLPCLLQRVGDRTGEAPSLNRFLWSAWLGPLIFFSISSAKANYYLVAVMPFAAFHLALALQRRDFLRAPLRLLPGLLSAALTAALLVSLAHRSADLQPIPLIAGHSPAQFLFLVLSMLTGLSLMTGWLAWLRPRVGILAYLALPAVCAGSLIIAANAVEPLVSAKPLVRYLRSEAIGRAVYLYRDFEALSSLPFYLQSPITVVDSRSSDLFWGNKLQQNNVMIDTGRFEHILSGGGSIAVVVLDSQIADFRASRLISSMKSEQRIGTATVFFN